MITNQDLDLIGHEVCCVIDQNILPFLEDIARDIKVLKDNLRVLHKIKKQIALRNQKLLIYPLHAETY